MVYAWRRWQRAAFGRNADRKADCRGGVFATRRFPRPPSPTTIRANRAYGDPTVFVATRRAALFSAFMPPSYGDLWSLSCRIAPQTAASRPKPRIVLQMPLHPHTNVLPTSYLGRFMFGFGLKAKPEDAVELVLSWYGEGMGESPCWYRNPPFHTAHGASRCDT